MRAAPLLGVVVAVALAATAPARAEDPQALGRAHAKRANQLSAAGRCRPAIPEFTKAYWMLRDPALLFNRAECYRKLGQSRKAVSDYRRFLTEMPTAPNRRAVEARLAALDPTYVPSPVPEVPDERPRTAGAPAPTAPTRPEETTLPGAAVPATGAANPPTAVAPSLSSSAPSLPPSPPSLPPSAPSLPPAAPSLPERPAAAATGEAPPAGPGGEAPPQAGPGAGVPGGEPPATVATRPAHAFDDRPAPAGLGERPPPEAPASHSPVPAWVWIGAGALLVAAGAAGGWYVLRPRTDVPPSSLGNYRF